MDPNDVKIVQIDMEKLTLEEMVTGRAVAALYQDNVEQGLRIASVLIQDLLELREKKKTAS